MISRSEIEMPLMSNPLMAGSKQRGVTGARHAMSEST
jgi:hypothetical protein